MTTINIKAVEVIQSVQDFNYNKDKEDDNIPLIQDKVTYIRFYLCSENVIPIDISASLKISYKQNDQDFTFLKTIKSIDISTIFNEDLSDEMQLRRLDWDKSLNFKLPKNFLSDLQMNFEESVELKFVLDKVFAVDENESESSKDREITPEADPKNEQLHQYLTGYKFERISANLRVVAYRYTDVETGEVYEPLPGELNVIKSYIESAFPISNLNWSTVTIEAPREFSQLYNVLERRERTDEQLDSVYTMLFQHLLAIRHQDISLKPDDELQPETDKSEQEKNLWELNTLYLGVLSDPNGRIIGSSMDSPGFATPHVVAFAGALPYGETAAHELAHMLGRVHPGIPDQDIHGKLIGQSDQRDSDENEDQLSGNDSSRRGYISDNYPENDTVVGLDTQSPLDPPLLLSNNDYFDLMTYRFPKWVSKETYKGLFKRLKEIEAMDGRDSGEKYWNVIGEYNFLKNTARINYILQSEYALPLTESEGNLKQNNKDKVAQKFKLKIRKIPLTIDDDSSTQKREQTEKELSNAVQGHPGEEVYLRRNLEKSGNSSYIGVFQHTFKVTDSDQPQRIELGINGQFVDVVMPGSELSNDDNDDDAKSHEKNINLPSDGRDPSKSDDIKHLQTQALSNDKHNLALIYSVDKNGYYLRFNWSQLEGQGKGETSGKSEIHDSIRSLFKSEQSQLPVTTTIQVKENSKSKLKSEHKDKWQTVAITNRIKDEFWITHDLLVKKTEANKNKGHRAPDLIVRNIRELIGDITKLGIRLRVCISIQGKRVEVFNSNSGKSINGLAVNPDVDPDSVGNKGYNNSNYYKSYRSNLMNGDEKLDEKLYYRPNVRDRVDP